MKPGSDGGVSTGKAFLPYFYWTRLPPAALTPPTARAPAAPPTAFTGARWGKGLGSFSWSVGANTHRGPVLATEPIGSASGLAGRVPSDLTPATRFLWLRVRQLSSGHSSWSPPHLISPCMRRQTIVTGTLARLARHARLSSRLHAWTGASVQHSVMIAAL
jgi:hypothetical protein